MSQVLEVNPPIVVTLSGDCGIGNAEELRAKLQAAIAGDSVVLDLSNATSVDSTALGMFVQLQKAIRARTGATIKIVTKNQQLRRVLAFTGLDRIFKVSDSIAFMR